MKTYEPIDMLDQIGLIRLNKNHKNIDTKTYHKSRALNANIYAPLADSIIFQKN